MDRTAELLRAWLPRCVSDIDAVIRGITVGTPITLEGATGNVYNSDGDAIYCYAQSEHYYIINSSKGREWVYLLGWS